RPRRSTRCPYTTLFRSLVVDAGDLPGLGECDEDAGALAQHLRRRGDERGDERGGAVTQVLGDGDARRVEVLGVREAGPATAVAVDRKSTRLNSSHVSIS